MTAFPPSNHPVLWIGVDLIKYFILPNRIQVVMKKISIGICINVMPTELYRSTERDARKECSADLRQTEMPPPGPSAFQPAISC